MSNHPKIMRQVTGRNPETGIEIEIEVDLDRILEKNIGITKIRIERETIKNHLKIPKKFINHLNLNQN